jgi:hypothetical protein
MRPAAAAEAGEPPVEEPHFAERGGQWLAPEVGMTARRWEATDVGDRGDAMCGEECEKIGERSRRVSDGVDDHRSTLYQKGRMRWVTLLALLSLGCPPPARYAEVRPGLSCERATRVAYRTIEALGYAITDVVVATPERTGGITGVRTDPDGTKHTGRVTITCDAKGAVVRPIEDSLFPDYEFSRGFGYSFKTLVQQPEFEEPRANIGLQILVHAITSQEATLDIGGPPTLGGTVPVRVTIRNNTDRAIAFDPARLQLVNGDTSSALTGSALQAALAAGGAGDRVRQELLTARRVAAHTTATGYLVFPAGTYHEARVTLDDVETGEGEGLVAPVK